jgi:hypothetical protein
MDTSAGQEELQQGQAVLRATNLIFTEYKDTANYVGAELKAVGVDGVAVVTGDSEDPTALAHRFSPLSNALPGQALRVRIG